MEHPLDMLNGSDPYNHHTAGKNLDARILISGDSGSFWRQKYLDFTRFGVFLPQISPFGRFGRVLFFRRHLLPFPLRTSERRPRHVCQPTSKATGGSGARREILVLDTGGPTPQDSSRSERTSLILNARSSVVLVWLVLLVLLLLWLWFKHNCPGRESEEQQKEAGHPFFQQRGRGTPSNSCGSPLIAAVSQSAGDSVVNPLVIPLLRVWKPPGLRTHPDTHFNCGVWFRFGHG